MPNNIEIIKQKLENDKNRIVIKNILMDWQNSKANLPALENALEQKLGSEDAKVYTAVPVRRLEIIILQIDLKKRGNVKEVKWFTENDDDVCKICQENRGKTFSVDEIDALIPAHEGCRCEVKPFLDVGLSEQKLREILENNKNND